MKGLLASTGHEGRLCQGFKTLFLVEIMDLIGLIVLDGLTLSIRVECKLKLKAQQEDLVTGNYLRTRVFLESIGRR